MARKKPAYDEQAELAAGWGMAAWMLVAEIAEAIANNDSRQRDVVLRLIARARKRPRGRAPGVSAARILLGDFHDRLLRSGAVTH